MKATGIRLTASVLFSAAFFPAFAAIRHAAVFTDGAVLQAKRSVPVWVIAEPDLNLVNSADLPATPFEIEL